MVAAGRQVPITARRQRIVLAVLLLNPGQTQPVSRLAAAVWGAEQPKNPENQIAVCVHGIRRGLAADGLAGLLATEPGGYTALVPAAATDLGRVVHLSAEAARLEHCGHPEVALIRYRDALAEWHGPLLQGLDIPHLTPETRWWEEKRVHVAEQAARLAVAVGDHQEAIGELSALAAAHPLRENLHALLMTALYHSGRRADALFAYRAAQDALRTGAGIDPSPQLRHLHHTILTDSRSPHFATVLPRAPKRAAAPC
ncbi:AfsR/SARP family transcriptional regulator [Actinokineospora diospyrosa]|uniref:DNA-binding transcriptional activator of the SARP family n=1 Tax=Actinokineospora diospyrosa TaxID=103728 RepID=A0ABT1ICS3_9PSEU|nr:AfsR/SARP family transcriptional regulator [Actinokineospora diospyrosa]MCP2270151.1 DNA-binding transcriptional activator of the SARP family [Actinokineospora diospyrosa]